MNVNGQNNNENEIGMPVLTVTFDQTTLLESYFFWLDPVFCFLETKFQRVYLKSFPFM